MELIPAVDLLGGRVVRLAKGDYDAVTTYEADPAEVARSFAQDGATRIHVVDLDAARSGQRRNGAAIEAILRATSLEVQVGGGVRDRASAEALFELGASRVVIGTAAVKDPAFVEALCARHVGKVIVAIDGRGGEVAIDGWLSPGGIGVVELAERVDGWGAAGILFTVIERDGMGAGPDVEATAALQARVRAQVIASGGIGALEHITALRRAGVRAAVSGKALYEKKLSLREALCAARGEAT